MSEESERTQRRLSPQAIHLLRTSMQANMTLSRMADQKASLLMGATFVVFTLAVGQASRAVYSPILLLLGTFAFISACLAVAAVLPRYGSKPISSSGANILFFGVFTEMDEGSFTQSVLDRLEDDEDIFRMMLRDIYQNGQVLQRRKYRLLSWSYRVFIAGLSLSMIAFLIDQREVFTRIF